MLSIYLKNPTLIKVLNRLSIENVEYILYNVPKNLIT